MSTPVLEPAANGYYYAYWSEGRRSRRKSMGTKDRAVAEKRFAQWLLLDGHRGGPSESSETPLTVDDCWHVYYEKHASKIASAEVNGYHWKNLKPHFGHLTVPQVNQAAVDEYVRKRVAGKIGRGAQPQTCRTELMILFAALRYCAGRHQRLFPATLIEEVTLPEAAPPRDRWLRIEEIQRLIEAAAKRRNGDRLSRLERFIWIALETASRKQAIYDLTWDRVDFEANVIHFHVPGERVTSKRRASVPISRTLRPILERAYRERINEYVLDNQHEIWAALKRAAREAKIENASEVSPHVLRHTAATHMARRGVPLWKIAKILGNTLPVVDRVYAKWAPDDPTTTVDLITDGALDPVG